MYISPETLSSSFLKLEKKTKQKYYLKSYFIGISKQCIYKFTVFFI